MTWWGGVGQRGINFIGEECQHVSPYQDLDLCVFNCVRASVRAPRGELQHSACNCLDLLHMIDMSDVGLLLEERA